MENIILRQISFKALTKDIAKEWLCVEMLTVQKDTYVEEEAVLKEKK